MRWSERRTAVRFTFCDDFHPFTPIDARSCPPSLILFSLDAFPRSRAWTPIQKWLITSLALLALAAFGILVYKYERYHRGPSESAFFGTWETTFVGLDSPCYFRLRADQTFQMASSPAMDEEAVFLSGTWYAGGQNLYIRFSAERMGRTRPQIWKIVDIVENEFAVRFPNGEIYVYKRVKSPAPTASTSRCSRRLAGLFPRSPMIKILPELASRALASRG